MDIAGFLCKFVCCLLLFVVLFVVVVFVFQWHLCNPLSPGAVPYALQVQSCCPIKRREKSAFG